MLIKGAKTQIICWTEGLRPFIRPYHVLVMDNAKIHRTDEIKDVLIAWGGSSPNTPMHFITENSC